MRKRPIYDHCLKSLQEAHDACMKNKDTVLGMSSGPFSGVNEVLGIVDTMEYQLQSIRKIVEEEAKEQVRGQDPPNVEALKD